MSHTSNNNDLDGVINTVNNSIVTYTNAIQLVTTLELDRSGWTRLCSQSVDWYLQAFLDVGGEFPKFLSSRCFEFDAILHGLGILRNFSF